MSSPSVAQLERDNWLHEVNIASIHQRLTQIEQGLPGKPELFLIELDPEEVEGDE